MLAANIPTRFPIPFANAAGGGFIRSIPVSSGTPGAADLTNGFPPVTFTPVGAGGIPPDGQDFNGLFNQITQWLVWQAAGGPVGYDATFSAAQGGYPAGTLLTAAGAVGQFWLSTVDNNTTDPDTGGSGWTPFYLGAGSTFSTGDKKERYDANLQPGWVRANGLTISKAGSGGTELADASAQSLYVYLYLNFSNTQCPVSGGRSGSNQAAALADFAAGKTIQLLDLRGMGSIASDSMGNSAAGRFAGVPFVSGSATTPGSVAGENTHVLVVGEIPGHTHNYSGTTGNENASHSHTYSGTTSGESNTHAHASVAGQFVVTTGGLALGGSGGAFTSATNTAANTVDHTHTYSGTTSTESATHGHAFSGTTDAGTGGGGAHNNVALAMVVTVFLKL